MNNKILVLGFFGLENNQLDGQTVKTRHIYKLLNSKKEEFSFLLSYFDTQMFKVNKLGFVKMFAKVWNTNNLIYIAAHNNLNYLFPLIYIIAQIRRIPIHYIVVGGWLSEFIESKPLHIRMLRNIKGIYPETTYLLEKLKSNYRFRNVYQLNNFRINVNNSDSLNAKVNNDNKISLVFMARVQPMKGVDTLFKLADRIESLKIEHVAIDIYGPINNEYKHEFEEKLKMNNILNYKGVIQPEYIQTVLCKYDLMLFPTKYFTEGFPGSVLDAYISGIPVIATNWKYAEEFIEHNVCGVITKFNDEDFVNSTIKLIESPEKIAILKKGVIQQAGKYSENSAWAILKERLHL